MSFNYYPILDQFFKQLFRVNQDWFAYRTHLEQTEQKDLFDAVILINGIVEEVQRKLNKKRALPKDNAQSKNTFVSTAPPG